MIVCMMIDGYCRSDSSGSRRSRKLLDAMHMFHMGVVCVNCLGDTESTEKVHPGI